ncbi:hypothetical protein BJ166DRAFT_611525, partial [Pestalotiopsis sp. NC0098]
GTSCTLDQSQTSKHCLGASTPIDHTPSCDQIDTTMKQYPHASARKSRTSTMTSGSSDIEDSSAEDAMNRNSPISRRTRSNARPRRDANSDNNATNHRKSTPKHGPDDEPSDQDDPEDDASVLSTNTASQNTASQQRIIHTSRNPRTTSGRIGDGSTGSTKSRADDGRGTRFPRRIIPDSDASNDDDIPKDDHPYDGNGDDANPEAADAPLGGDSENGQNEDDPIVFVTDPEDDADDASSDAGPNVDSDNAPSVVPVKPVTVIKAKTFTMLPLDVLFGPPDAKEKACKATERNKRTLAHLDRRLPVYRDEYKVNRLSLEHHAGDQEPWALLEHDHMIINSRFMELEAMEDQMSKGCLGAGAKKDAANEYFGRSAKILDRVNAIKPTKLSPEFVQLVLRMIMHTVGLGLLESLVPSAQPALRVWQQNQNNLQGPSSGPPLAPLVSSAGIDLSPSQVELRAKEESHYLGKYTEAESRRQDSEKRLEDTKRLLSQAQTNAEEQDVQKKQLENVIDQGKKELGHAAESIKKDQAKLALLDTQPRLEREALSVMEHERDGALAQCQQYMELYQKARDTSRKTPGAAKADNLELQHDLDSVRLDLKHEKELKSKLEEILKKRNDSHKTAVTELANATALVTELEQTIFDQDTRISAISQTAVALQRALGKVQILEAAARRHHEDLARTSGVLSLAKQMLADAESKHEELRATLALNPDNRCEVAVQKAILLLDTMIGGLSEGDSWEHFLDTYLKRDPRSSPTAAARPMLLIRPPWTAAELDLLPRTSMWERSAQLYWMISRNDWTRPKVVNALELLYLISSDIQRGHDYSGVRDMLTSRTIKRFLEGISVQAYLHDFAILQLAQLSKFMARGGEGGLWAEMSMMKGPRTSLPRVLGCLVEQKMQVDSRSIKAALDTKNSQVVGHFAIYCDDNTDNYWALVNFNDCSIQVIDRQLAQKPEYFMAGNKYGFKIIVSCPRPERWGAGLRFDDISSDLHTFWMARVVNLPPIDFDVLEGYEPIYTDEERAEEMELVMKYLSKN